MNDINKLFMLFNLFKILAAGRSEYQLVLHDDYSGFIFNTKLDEIQVDSWNNLEEGIKYIMDEIGDQFSRFIRKEELK